MSLGTDVSWATDTWGIVVGCDPTSPACGMVRWLADRTGGCYSIHLSHMRASNPHPAVSEVYQGLTHRDADDRLAWNGTVKMLPQRLADPFGYPKRGAQRRVFVCSMGDFLHPKVTDEFIAKAFAVMALNPHLVFQVLTKRHARLAALLNSGAFANLVFRALYDIVDELPDDVSVPAENFDAAALLLGSRERSDEPMPALPNVWVGGSVERQEEAELRIPALLRVPDGWIRWLSCEPLLGPLDLTKWIPPRVPVSPADAPKTWAEWTWPDWVPAQAREQIEYFWADHLHRGPRAWLDNALSNGAPAFGQRWKTPPEMRMPSNPVGRYIHAWNNMGRVLTDDGEMGYTSFSPTSVHRQQPIHWVVVGGESGRGRSRPMHPRWPDEVLDQCRRASVAFHFKQHGDFSPFETGAANPEPGARRGRSYVVVHDGRFCTSEEFFQDDYPDRGEIAAAMRRQCRTGGQGGLDPYAVYEVGKKAAGRELHGREWNEYPQPIESRRLTSVR